MTRPMQLPSTYRPMLVSSGVRSSLERAPDKIALSCAGRSLTYRRLVDRFDRVSGLALDGLGLKPGDRVALVAPNCLEYVEIVCGMSDMGVAVATINPRQTPAEIGYVLSDCGARVVFVTPATEPIVRAADLPAVERIIVIGEAYEDLLANARAPASRPPVQEWDAFSIPYTSGTTGKPRGVVLPHRARVMNFFAMAVEYDCYTPDSRYLALAPLFHGAGFAFAHASIYFGGTCEIMPAFEPEAVLAALKATRANGTFMVPTHFHAMFALEKPILDRHRGLDLKSICSNAAPLPQRTKETIVDYFGDGLLHEIYGSTEAAIVTNLRPQDQLRKIQCVGTPFPMNHVRLLGEDGREVKAGEVGELYSSAPTFFLGYWNQPEATAASFRDGWFSAGDMARKDEEGFIYIVDRKKDMFISGGVNVYPREIEEHLFRLAGVKEAAVIGAPDDYWGEVGKAFVVRTPGSAVSEADVVAWCKDKLAGYKVPRHVRFVDTIPRNAAGKVLKTELRKLP